MKKRFGQTALFLKAVSVFPDRFLPARDFSFVVIDRLGTNHALLRRSEGMAGSVGHFSIEPGKRREWIAEIHPDKTLKPGIYQLQVKRPFFDDRKQRREVISILKEIELR